MLTKTERQIIILHYMFFHYHFELFQEDEFFQFYVNAKDLLNNKGALA